MGSESVAKHAAIQRRPDLGSAPERRWRALHRFARNRLAVLGALCLAAMFSMAAFAPWLTSADPLAQDWGDALALPSWTHPCGTDQLGRDIWARVAYGAMTSLMVGFVSLISGSSVGLVLGLVAGYAGGWVDNLIMRAMDVMFAMPSILLAIVVVTWLGPSLTNAMLAIAVVRVPRSARLMRSVVLTIMPKEYILACRVIGVKATGILRSHLLPNAMPPLIVDLSISLAFCILSTAGLGFLGLGAQPPTPEWGAMISEGRWFLYTGFHATLFPGLAIFLTTVSLNLMGDGLQDALNPRLTS